MLKKRFDEIMDLFEKNELFSGVVYLKQSNEEIYSKSIGYANKEHKVPNNLNIKFATASVTKMFTAVGIFQLIEEGLVSLETKVVDYLGLENTLIPEDVEIQHLLSHTSGIADYYDEEDPEGFELLWKDVPCNAIDYLPKMLPLFLDENPKYVLGEKFSYNGAGFILLGIIIQHASGIDYFDYIRENIFKKIGMDDSDFISLDTVSKNIAEGYIPINDGENHIKGWRKNIYSVPAHGLSDGGAFSTAKDLVCFMKSLREGKLFNVDSLEYYLKPVVDVSKNWKYGFGFWFDVEDEMILRYGHTGEDPGVSARVFYYPELDLDFVVLGNQSFCTGNLTWQLHQIILEEIEDYKKNWSNLY